MNQNENRDSWDMDKERLLLYADIMGFKSMVSGDHKEVKNRLIKFKDTFGKIASPLQLGNHLKFVQFSDSIIIVVNGTTKKMFNLLAKASIALMRTAMGMSIPIKGAIAQGIFSFDEQKQLYFGKPLVDAYLLHDEVKYYGIVIHHTAEKIAEIVSENSSYIKKNSVPFKSGDISHFHLCWNLLDEKFADGDITETCEKWLDSIREFVSGAPRVYIDNTLKVLKSDSNDSPQSSTSTRPRSS